jgi:ureidoglycolate dehydrogenase (NAD+)
MYAELTRPRRIGAFFIAIDPVRFAGGATFAAAVELIARALTAQPGQVLMPGDPELAEERRRRADGVPIEPGLRDEMRSWSERLKVTSPL